MLKKKKNSAIFVFIFYCYQWRIQDFPKEGAPTPRRGGANIRFCQIFPKTAWIERIWTPRGARVPCAPLDPPLAMLIYDWSETIIDQRNLLFGGKKTKQVSVFSSKFLLLEIGPGWKAAILNSVTEFYIILANIKELRKHYGLLCRRINRCCWFNWWPWFWRWRSGIRFWRLSTGLHRYIWNSQFKYIT